MSSVDEPSLFDTVIDNGYCIGCGACSYADPNTYSVEIDVYGMYQANVLSEKESKDSKSQSLSRSPSPKEVCPFSDVGPNEDEIAAEKFSDEIPHNDKIGKHISCYAGHVEVGEFRDAGSSGGFGKWLLTELLERGEVDYVIQVTPKFNRDDKEEIFKYGVFDSADEILEGSKSAYYPVSMNEALEFIKENEGQYAITALPCFSKALELVRRQDEVIDERVSYTLGLVCGHLKSKAFAQSFGWELGVRPDDLAGIDFRGETQGEKANEKGVYAINKDGERSPTVSSRDLIGGNWGHNVFRYKACDYCDDVVGETADVTFGDAWIPPYEDDPDGANVVVTRNERLEEIIREAIENGALEFDDISAEDVIESQAGGLRDRRQGLAYRLARQVEKGNWYPEKRVEPAKTGSKQRDKVYEKRMELREKSHEFFLEAKRRDDFKYYAENMKPLMKDLEVIKKGRAKAVLADTLETLHLKEAILTSRDTVKSIVNK